MEESSTFTASAPTVAGLGGKPRARLYCYTSETVARKTGIPYRTLMDWVGKGLIEPLVQRRGGRKRLLFSKENIREALIIKQLREYISLQKIRLALADLREMGQNPLSGGAFFVVRNLRGERMVIKVCAPDRAIELLKEDPKQIELFPTREIEKIIEGLEPEPEFESDPDPKPGLEAVRRGVRTRP
jgi:DNA-binding transcriptional MerR regulator